MNNALTIAIPTFAVRLSVIFHRQEMIALRTELMRDIGQVRSEIGQLRSEMMQLRDSIHRDMVGLHERFAFVEAKQDAK